MPFKVNRDDLLNAQGDWDYLYVILNQYNVLLQSQPEKGLDPFNDSQLALLAYRGLDAQVNNGGFLQLIFNGYAGAVFDSGFAHTLRQWGADATARLLDSIRPQCLEMARELELAGQFGPQRSWDALTQLYEANPQFDAHDDAYYALNAADAGHVRRYVAQHLPDFIQVE